MKTRNLTPFAFGFTITSRRPRTPELSVFVRACYLIAPGKPLALPEGPPLLAQGPVSADTYRDDDDERAGECLYPGDFAAWKPKAEVMLRGTCFAPGGAPVGECPVRFEVGRWSKILRVIGRRFWSDDLAGAVMSDPAPFTKMPIGYANAFGGSEYARNPVGMGAAGRELPNVEHAGAVIRARRDDPGPAGFGPLNPAWPQRGGKIGKEYGARYRKERWPYYAEDFDWTYFNAAPADQQLEGYLRGDEKILFQNLHPEAPVLEARLPGVRVRAFVNDVKQRFREVPMSLDTLFADLDEGKLYLTWRGLDAIETDDMTDVETLLVGSERLDEARGAADYQAELAAFEADPLGLKDRVPAELLQQLDDAKKKLEAVRAYQPPPPSLEPPPDPVTGLLRKHREAFPLPLGPQAAEAEAQVAKIVADTLAKAPPEMNMNAEIAKLVDAFANAPPPAPAIASVPLRLDGPPPAWAANGLRDALARAEQMKGLLVDRQIPAEMGGQIPASAMDRFAELDKSLPPEMTKMIDDGNKAMQERIDAVKKDPFFKAMLDRPLPEEPGPYKDLHGQDYQGRDLRGMDLRGANLEDANLAGAKLAGAKLADAKLTGAMLVQADLTGADFTGADLTLANLTRAQAKGASFRGATLDQALFEQANLSGASLAGAKGKDTILTNTNLAGVDAKGISLHKALLMKANLAEADLSGASLTWCNLLEADATKVNLARATLTRTGFIKTDLRGASLVEAQGDHSAWLMAKLGDADFSRAVLPKAELLMVSAERASFRRAVLKEANCYRAALDQADLSECNLFGANLSKCSLNDARFTGSNLYGVSFLQAAGKNCDFSGANLKRANVMEEPS